MSALRKIEPHQLSELSELDEQKFLEQRKHRRDSASDLCEIRLGTKDFVSACLIENISKSGAKLIVSYKDIPSRFILVNHTKGTRVLCRLVWRDGNHLGIEFLTEPRSFEDG